MDADERRDGEEQRVHHGLCFSSADEDFAEMVSIMLTNSPEDWDNMIENAGNAAAVEALRKKEAIVVAYMKNNWGVNMKDFQKEVVAAIEAAVRN